MRILALITARGGSKRLPGKNIRQLGGKPLIAWTIEAARSAGAVSDILVSTDDPQIASVARSAGVLVPWLRPAALATDTSTSVDVALHALAWFEAEEGGVDGLLLLQPTSPFRTANTIRRGIELFEKHRGKPVIGVSPAVNHPLWTFGLKDGLLEPYIEKHGMDIRSQDLPAAYVVNGCFYLITPADLRLRHSFIGLKMVPLVIESSPEALDIDTEADWGLAESLIAASVK